MKRFISLAVTLLMVVGICTGCGNSEGSTGEASVENTSQGTEQAGKVYQVGIVQPVEHPSLNEIRNAIEEELKASLGDQVEIEYQNANGETSNLSLICNNFVASKKDAIVAIATPAALAAVTATDGTGIPVIYSAVTDPQNLGLAPETGSTPLGNFTGVGYGIPVTEIFDLAFEINPNIQKVGFIYDTGEENSVNAMSQAKEYLKAKGISYEDGAVTSTNDLQMATQQLLAKKVDILFSPTDNTVASAFMPIAAIAEEGGVPYYVGADSMVKDGGFATIGINYVNLGKETAKLTVQVLEAGTAETIDVIYIQEYQKVINEDVANTIGIDVQGSLFENAEFVHTGDNEKV